MSLVSRGFRRRHQVDAPAGRVPPGQYVTSDFPVLSAGPTPRVSTDDWRLVVTTESGAETSWSWSEFTGLPTEEFTVDIHCVTKWSRLDTVWEGVAIDTLLADVDSSASHAMIHCYGGYTTNVPIADLTGGKAWIAHVHAGEPLPAVHGGPARLVVPHLYFWKSAKWVRGIELLTADRPGFWESYGYHIYGDPWREQRYTGD